MAVEARVHLEGRHLDLQLHPDERRSRVSDDPPELRGFEFGSTTWPYYDGEKLDRGEYEFVGIEVSSIGDLSDEDIAAIERLPWPRVNCREQGLLDASVADVLRWAKRAYQEALARGQGQVWGTAQAAPEALKPGASPT
jgi:hypothetical protein